MTIKTVLIKDSSIVLLYFIFSKIINYSLLIVQTKLLIKEDFGAYSFIILIINSSIIISSLGIPQGIVKFLAEKSNDLIYQSQIFIQSIIIILFSSILTGLILFIINQLSSYSFSFDNNTTLIIILCEIFGSISILIQGYFQGQKRIFHYSEINYY